jgi:hypothetical protein
MIKRDEEGQSLAQGNTASMGVAGVDTTGTFYNPSAGSESGPQFVHHTPGHIAVVSLSCVFKDSPA